MRLAVVFTCASALAFAQTFEVASVKMAPPESIGVTKVEGGVGEKDSSQVTYRNISIMNLLGRACGPHNFWQIVGPDWLGTQRYDVSAKIPPGATKEDFQAMLQHLLEERFGMKLHHEQREFKAWDLVVNAKSGPKLQASSPNELPMMPAPDDPDHDKDGFPILNRKEFGVLFDNRKDGTPVARMVARDQPLSILLNYLSQELKAPVIDKTGLNQTYDFRLEYSPFLLQQAAAENGELQAPGLVTAIKSLGLGVVETKIPQDVLVIDHIDRTPTEN